MQVPPWKRIDNFSVTAHQRLVDGHNATAITTPAGGPLEIQNSPYGRGIVWKGLPRTPQHTFSVWIVGPLTGAGKYEGHVYEPQTPEPVSVTTNVDTADMGGASGAVVDIAIFKSLEKEHSGHWLTDGGPTPDRPILAWWHPGGAYTDEEPPRRIAIIADPGTFGDCVE
jgi:hypothetical protein